MKYETSAAALTALNAFAPPDYCGPELERINHINFELTAIFAEAGFSPIEPAILQPADILFDLYGEEIWDRSFVIEDIEHGAWCLRPDFTAPVARSYLASVQAGSEVGAPARYGYFGPVFRRARGAGDGALQQLQAGVEIIGEPEVAERDAEVFDLARRALEWAGCKRYQVVLGDLGLIFGVLDAVPMPDSWRTRLRRRFWRPERFNALLRRLSGGPAAQHADSRVAFLKGLGSLGPEEAERAVEEMMALAETPQIGVRSAAEVAERFLRQAEDAQAHPLPSESAALIEAAAGVTGSAADALTTFETLARDARVDLSAQCALYAQRLDALSARGVEPNDLTFDAVFGRDLAYYDGFVFEMRPPPDPADPSGAHTLGRLGGGGRYDRLFTALGAPRPVQGVGAALKPEAILAAAAREQAQTDQRAPQREEKP
ncbi:MAG: ATP phosphoribosyltransferase regulatory subunit [Pseudomonadota bacterium]